MTSVISLDFYQCKTQKIKLDNCLCCSSVTANRSSNESADLEQTVSHWLDLCLITYTNMICLGGIPFCWQLNNIHFISLTCLLTNFYNSSYKNQYANSCSGDVYFLHMEITLKCQNCSDLVLRLLISQFSLTFSYSWKELNWWIEFL